MFLNYSVYHKNSRSLWTMEYPKCRYCKAEVPAFIFFKNLFLKKQNYFATCKYKKTLEDFI